MFSYYESVISPNIFVTCIGKSVDSFSIYEQILSHLPTILSLYKYVCEPHTCRVWITTVVGKVSLDVKRMVKKMDPMGRIWEGPLLKILINLLAFFSFVSTNKFNLQKIKNGELKQMGLI